MRYDLDPTKLEPDPVIADQDGDRVADELDNCLAIENPTQNDEDSDTLGDACHAASLRAPSSRASFR